ncbi:MAG: nicotinate (nicotinamide) nucleotide adenylyltransferase [Clostridium sp.]|jgi:nicotinate-nucleotide adenylyltransferase|nr:nicotinate (nicotinamide) nucleotide adenylyltransferase [Clostridium sp.]
MKIGVFGGTFNPPHNGHVRLAKAAADELKLDKLLVIPSCIPPHKIAAKLADGQERLEMCRLAFGGDPRLEVSPMELERGSRSYTVETLRELKALYPDSELYFIVGSDMLESFDKWYLWQEILSLSVLCAASREEGYSPDLSRFGKLAERIKIITLDPLEVSSTQIRNSAGEVSSELLDPKVAAYIREHGLYDDGLNRYRELLRGKLNPRRLFHSECVSECAGVLAERYGASVEKARLAGLLHDVMKNAPANEQLALMPDITPLELLNTKVWHQISGEAFLRQNGIVTDEEILGAVRWHTTGKAGMTLLEKIIYVADFISSDRDYNDVEVVRRLAYISLEHAILYTSRYTVNKMVSQDLLLHPATVECYNDMLMHFGIQKG